jgi:hypothetical protein
MTPARVDDHGGINIIRMIGNVRIWQEAKK